MKKMFCEAKPKLRSNFIFPSRLFLKGLMGFRNSIITTGVNIPKLMVDYVLSI